MSGILMASVGNSYGYKPVNTVAPAVTGTATFGQTLSCSTGTWEAAPLPISYAFQCTKNLTHTPRIPKPKNNKHNITYVI
jgi:hypothetical protein